MVRQLRGPVKKESKQEKRLRKQENSEALNNLIMDDPRFFHLTSDPRFKRVPYRERKVKIDSRFKRMFSNQHFKVKYKRDKRGRKVNQSSSEDLRKYYHLEDVSPLCEDHDQHSVSEDSDGETPGEHSVSKDSEGETPSEHSVSEDSEGEAPGEHSVSDYTWSGDVCDVKMSEQTSARLALCDMDWDKIDARDVYVLVNSFKPSEGSILQVSVYPSEFGLRRMAEEEVAGPALEEQPVSQEALREYQLSRLRYYYAVIECDSQSTAETIYHECDGLEYEASGGQLDFRFIPENVSFEGQKPHSTATEHTLPLSFTPASFVNKALQQSKVQLSWDETDPHRLKSTTKKFSQDDAALMDFSAYLASDDEDSYDGDKYKALLEDKVKGHSGAEEEMEITWDPGLRENTGKILTKKKLTGGGLTRWEQYLNERKRKKREKRLKRQEKVSSNVKNGFDDKFFQSVPNAQKSNKRVVKDRGSSLEQPKDGLELLVIDEQEENGDFKVNVTDPRFEALYFSPLFAPDPAHPYYRNTKGMEALMKEKMRQRQMKQQSSNSRLLARTVQKNTNILGTKSIKQK